MNNIPINDEMDRNEIFFLPMLPTVYACVVGVLFPDIIYVFKLRGRWGVFTSGLTGSWSCLMTSSVTVCISGPYSS